MNYCPQCGSRVVDAGASVCSNCGKPLALPGPSPGGCKTSPAVIVVIAVAVIVGGIMFLGMVAAIAIPNLLNAIDRGKQKRTMADIQAIATAVESYAVDHDSYPTSANIGELKTLLEPDYIKVMPDVDGWSHPLAFFPREPVGSGYTIGSFGKDGVGETAPRGGPTMDFDCDIVFVDGAFTQWPDGLLR